MISYGHKITRAVLRIRAQRVDFHQFAEGGCQMFPLGPVRYRMNHVYVRTFPARWVWRGEPPLTACQKCRKKYRVWIADDATWRRLPRSWWKKRLCTRCFRAIVAKKESS